MARPSSPPARPARPAPNASLIAPTGGFELRRWRRGRLRGLALWFGSLLFMAQIGLCGAQAGAEEGAPDPLAAGLGARERLDRLVERVKLEQSRVTSMSAKFVQDRDSRVLLEPETSSGRLYYRAPDRVRWEYVEPKPIVMTIDGDRMTTFFQDLGTAEQASIGNYSEQVFKYLGATGSLETLMKYFSLTADFPEHETDPYHLELLPRYTRIKKRLRSMDIWLDAKSFLPRRLRYVEANGDQTEYRFENMVANAALSDDLFEVDLPAGTKIRTVDLRGR